MTLDRGHVESPISIKITWQKVSHLMIISYNLFPIGRLVSREKMKKGKIAEAGNLPWRPCFFLSDLHLNYKFLSGPPYDYHCLIDLSYSMRYWLRKCVCILKNTSLFYSKIIFRTSWNSCRTRNLWQLLVQGDKLKTNVII